MGDAMSDDEREMGVYYAPGDCLGLMRRLLIDAIDGCVLLFAWLAGLVVILMLGIHESLANRLYFVFVMGSAFLYLVALKRYGRTLGYVAARAEVVTMQGKAPSVWALCVRAVFLCLGPMNALVDVAWLASDPNRQAIRDKFARTYVVRRGSVPVGEGAIRYVRLDMLGWQLLLPEVVRAGADAQKV